VSGVVEVELHGNHARDHSRGEGAVRAWLQEDAKLVGVRGHVRRVHSEHDPPLELCEVIVRQNGRIAEPNNSESVQRVAAAVEDKGHGLAWRGSRKRGKGWDWVGFGAACCVDPPIDLSGP
jgi:hypothetical protein